MSVNKVILVGRLGRDPKTRYQGWGQRTANRVQLFIFLSPTPWSAFLTCDEVDGAPFEPLLLQVCH